MRSKGFAPLLVVVIIALIGILGYFTYRNNPLDTNQTPRPTLLPQETSEPSPTTRNVISTIEKSTKEGWNKYINQQAKFTILFPRKLYIIDENAAVPEKYESGHVTFCTENTSNKICPRGEFYILFGVPFIDGKGGSCDAEDVTVSYFTLLDKEHWVCISDYHFGGLYIKHPTEYSELGFRAHYSDNFTKEEAMEMLNSLEFKD